MSQPYIGEIRMFGGSFAPAGWAFCAGQLMPISENDTLFNLIGTTYGGDGQETFGLPDLQGRVPLHMGQGPGILQNYQIGEKGGVETVTLTIQQIPGHTHTLLASADGASATAPGPNVILGRAQAATITPYGEDNPQRNLVPTMLDPVGGSQPHDNMQPTLGVSYIISLFGIYPTQS